MQRITQGYTFHRQPSLFFLDGQDEIGEIVIRKFQGTLGSMGESENMKRKTKEKDQKKSDHAHTKIQTMLLLYSGEYLWPCFQHGGSSRYRAIAVPAINAIASDKKRSRSGSKAAEGPKRPL